MTEDGLFAATVRLPRTPDVEEGLANFLTPPLGWAATPPQADEAWGTHSRSQDLGFKGVAIQRLAFTIHANSGMVDPAIRAEWGEYPLGQQILHNIDTWWENVRTWLEIATNQRLAQVGHESNDWLNPHTRTALWTINDDEHKPSTIR
jgi:hypothetical protein